MVDGVLYSYSVSDDEIDISTRVMLKSLMFTKDNTLPVIRAILEHKVDVIQPDNMKNKLQVVDQFRIHMKLIPDVYDIEWNDNEFVVEFTLWEFDLQAHYNIDTHMLTNISYMSCDKTLEIDNFTIELSVENASTLTELLNNPRVFLVRNNRQAYEKYLKMCENEE